MDRANRYALASMALVSLATADVSRQGAANAAESATSVYLLGSKGPMAGFTPPPGVYVGELDYYYSGDASGTAALGVTLRRTGAASAVGVPLTLEADLGVHATAHYSIPTVLWMTPHKIFGGQLGFSLALPVGRKVIDVDIDARATITLPPPIGTLTAGRHFDLQDKWFNFGDPIASALIGWHHGNLHTSLSTMVNIPAGAWEQRRLANIGFNHWAIDTTAAATWLDPKVGLEVSVASGVTFNFENPDTNYKTGTEFHAELAIMQHFSPAFSLGLTGYHYQQITGDSGSGAVLGDFKGKVTALGPGMTYNTIVGNVPVSTSLKWQHEFNVENRVKGDATMFTVLIPLGPPPPVAK